MSISSRITQIENHLEDDYKALENLGASVTDRNIENIKDMAEQIYDNYPKTSYGEGTSVTLENCNKGKLDFEDGKVGYGQTKQAILPDEYQEVEYIESSGTQYIDTGLQATYTSNARFTFAYDFIEQLNREQTIIGGKDTLGQGTTIYHYANSLNLATWCGSGTAWNITSVITNAHNYVDITFSVPKGRSALVNGVNYSDNNIQNNAISVTDNFAIFSDNSRNANNTAIIKLYSFKIYIDNELKRDMYPCYRKSDNVIGMYDIVGNTFYTNSGTGTFTKGADAPTPNQEIPIQSVTGNQVVRVRGIQLFNKNDYLQGYAYMGSEKVQNANWGIAYIPCQANETFTISGLKGYANTYIAQTDTSKTFVSNLAQRTSSSTQYTITSTQTGYIGVTFLWNEVGEGSELDIMMINEGSTAKPYEPYYTPITKTLALGDRKVFEGDYFWIDKNTGKKYHHHSKTEYAFTGQEGFSKSQSYPGGYYRGWDLMDGVNNAPFLCTHAKYVSSLSDYVVGTCYSDTSCSLRLGDAEELPTTDSFKALLAQLYANGTPVTIVYQLATETDEEITDTLAEQIDEIDNLQSITGTTIIESNGDLPLIIKVRALKGE